MGAKGKAFKATLDYLEEKYDQKKVKSFFQCHPQFEKIRKYDDLNWYSLDELLKFSECVDKYFGFGDASLLFKIGEHAAKDAFNNSHKLFKDLSIESVFSNAGAVFCSYYSAGAAEIKYIKDNKVHVCIKNLPVSPYLAKSIFGWMQHAVKAIKAKEAFVSEEEGKKCLCYTVEWNKIAG